MRVTKPRQEFDFLDTVHKINKMQGSPRYLSKENLPINKNQNSTVFPKDSILNNIPIKVRLIRAAELNPNINMGKIHNLNRNAKTLKKELEIKKTGENTEKNQKKNKNDTSFNSNSSKKDEEKTNTESNTNTKNMKNDNNELSDTNTLSPKIGIANNQSSDVYKLKKLLISPKINEKDRENVNPLKTNNIKTNKFNQGKSLKNDEDNYDNNTYNQNDQKEKITQNFAYNKPKKGNIAGNTYSILAQKGYIKNSTNTETTEVKESDNKSYVLSNCDSSICSSSFKNFNICNSPKIIKKNKIINNNENNNSNNNIPVNNINNIIRISQKKNNKNYGLNTYIQKNQNMIISNRLNTSPFKLRNNSNNNSNNNSFNLNNNYNYNINVLNYSPKKEIINKNINYDNIDIKLDDLILFEERLSDISIALNNYKNINDGGASNECIEFFVFYFHSSLKYIFPYFFNGMNKIIIKSAINLKLFTIVITYHLSMNPTILTKLVEELKNIFSLLKMNLYLFIKKIQLFYGENYTKQNEIYFKTFNYILTKKGFYNCNEEEIAKVINKNCCEIVQYLNNILNFYKTIENNYYLDFIEIFASISKITEKEINNYFYNHLYANSAKGTPQPKYNSTKKNMNFDGVGIITNNNIKINITNNSSRGKIETSPTKIIRHSGKILNILSSKDQENLVIMEYQKNKISPPFLKTPNPKKYTVVLDLDETLVNINQEGVCNLRPGLFSFLNSIKSFYEIISFTNGAKSYSDSIIKQIEARKKYFDYNLYREHSFLYGKEFIKDISRIGRDMKRIIIVDNIPNNYRLNPENGIQIAPYFGEYSKNDTVLFELKKLLIMFHKLDYEDLRVAIKDYKKDIKNNITRENID
jgi:TFIIF-interacting CTD phosphatase-like protein